MRIAIDVSSIIYGTGVAVYTRELVKALARIGKRHEYVLFGGSLRRRGEFGEWFERERFPDNFELRVFYWPPTVADWAWNRLRWPPWEWFVGKVDVVHSPDWTMPPTEVRKVVTIHDLYFLGHPEETDAKIFNTLKRRLEVVGREADGVIAVSKATKRDVVRLLGIPEEKVRVVYEATGLSGLRIQNSKLKVSSQEWNLLGEHKIDGPYFLAVGTVERRKNYARLIDAFARTQDTEFKICNGSGKSLKFETGNLQLVIAGREGNAVEEVRERIREQKLEGRVRLLGYVADKELRELYKNTVALVYPSLYEGFGIPVLEAFACECPVITSEVSSLPEVGGEAVVYVDPLDVGEIARAMKKVVRWSGVERKKWIKKGLAQVKKFSWEKAARETVRVYEQI